jgi:tetratricopeptide (TPR) repeat protein
VGLLAAAARQQPLLIILDDLQWADVASLQLLRHTVEDMEGVALLLVGLLREGEATAGASLLAELTRHPNSRSLSLRGLSPAEVERFLVLALGWEPDEDLVAAFYRETAGSPFLVTEVLRLLATEGALCEVTEETLASLLPQGVQELVRRRLSLLTPSAGAILESAAVLGLEFRADEIERVTSLPPESCREGLAEAAASRLLAEVGGGSYRFSHALLRATVLRGMSTSARAHLHLAAASVLEALASGGVISRAPEIAYHLFEALPQGEPRAAAEYALLAGEDAEARYAWEGAVGHFRRGLEICDGHGVAGTLLRERLATGSGDCLVALARREEGLAAYRQALELASAQLEGGQEGGSSRDGAERRQTNLRRARLYGRMAAACVADRRFDEAEHAFSAGLAVLPPEEAGRSGEEWSEWVALQLARAEACYHAGLLHELAGLLPALGPLVDVHGEPGQRADLLASWTMFHLRQSSYRPGPEALESAQAELATRLLEESLRPAACAAYFRLGFVQLLQEAFEEARSNLEAALAEAGHIGDRVRRTQASAYLSQLHRRCGRPEAVRRQAQEAMRAAERSGLPGYAAAAQSDLAWVLLREGHVLEAREQAGKALSVWGPDSTWPFEWLARFPLAAVAFERGCVEEAAGHFQATLRPSQQRLTPSLQEAMEQAVCAVGSQTAEAAAAVEQALTLARLGNYI